MTISGIFFVIRLGENAAVQGGWKYVLQEDKSLVLVRRFGQSYLFVDVDLATGLIGDRMELRDLQISSIKMRRVKTPQLISRRSQLLANP
jgi:hypothetical protein